MNEMDKKDIFDACLSANKKIDDAFRLILSAKYIASDPEVKRDLLDALDWLISAEEKSIDVMLKVNDYEIHY